MKRVVTLVVLIGAVALGACGTGGAGGGQAQVVSGMVAQASFTGPVSVARVVRSGKVVATSPVAADGSFRLEVPVGSGYAIEFAREGVAVGLVFPRSGGQIHSRFDVRVAGTAFDLGTVRHVGSPSGLAFKFKKAQAGTADGQEAADGQDASTDGDNVQCEDGIDAVTGAVCVDDGAEEKGQTCEADTATADGDSVNCEDGIDPATGKECDGGPAANAGNDGEDGGKAEKADGDSVNCENGIDPATGKECDGGPAANAGNDGAEGGAEDALPADAAVPDHNLASAMGCPEADGDTVNCENGIDPATGKECDGGPAANAAGQE